MLSSLGLGNAVNGLTQALLASGSTASTTGPENSVQNVADTVAATPVETLDDAVDGAVTPSGTSYGIGAYTASQGVEPVGKSAAAVQSAYAQRSESEDVDADRAAAIATQQASFRLQLIERLGQGPANSDIVSRVSPVDEAQAAYGQAKSEATPGGAASEYDA